MKLLRKKVTYNDKNGKERKGYNFYLRLPNGTYVPIKNVFKEGYLPLVIVAEEMEDAK